MSELNQAEDGFSHTQTYKVKEHKIPNKGNLDGSPLSSYKRGIINTTGHAKVYSSHKEA